MRTFSGILIRPYLGVPYMVPTAMCGRDVKVVPIVIDWSAYNVSSSLSSMGIAVSFVGAGATASLIPRLAMVYIDNTSSNVPVYIRFSDSGQVIVAQPYSAGWYPCLTATFTATIYGVGFVTGQIPITQFLFSDTFVPPFSALELQQAQVLYKASRSITRGTTIFNQDFSVPAIGDQTTQTTLNLTTNGVTATVMNTPYAAPANFLYLIGLSIFLCNVARASGGVYDLFLESTGAAGILFQWNFGVGTAQSNLLMFNQTGMNLKLDAAQTWRLRGDTNNLNAGSNANCIFIFSTNPY